MEYIALFIQAAFVENLDQLPDIDAIIIDPDGRLLYSDGLSGL